jgi:hypothetical protein
MSAYNFAIPNTMKKLSTLVIAGLFCLPAVLFSQTSQEGFGQIRSNLYIVGPDNSTTLMDGSLTQYDSTYSNEMDRFDARKMSNFSENWGMLRGNTVYVVERRHTITDKDSIFFKMWNMRIITYQLEFIASKLDYNGRTAILIDKYLKTETPVHLNDTTRIPFSVTKDADSKATDRFTLIFSFPEVIKTPPLEIVKTQVFAQHKEATLIWHTEGYSEKSVFEIQRSENGIHFQKADHIIADSGVHHYEWKDKNVIQGKINYYRIKLSSQKDSTVMGSVVSTFIEKVNDGITAFPNPVTGKYLNVNIVDEPKGQYTISLNNSFGLKILSKTVQYNGGKQTEQLSLNQMMKKGVYHLKISGPDGYQKVISVLF